MRLRQTLPLSLAAMAGLCLTACDSGLESAPAGAVSEGEDAALEEAAKMLDAQRLPEGALPQVDPPPADTPEGT